MNRKTILAVLIITISFSIGYVAYEGTYLFVEFVRSRVNTCENLPHTCRRQQRTAPEYNY